VLYEMLTGKRAFEGRSGISTLSAILRDDVKPINQAAPDVPPLLEQIVLRCLYKEPSARWQSMKDIESALLTLQRQLDPEGHFASPLPTGPVTVASTPAAPPSIVQAAVPEARPATLASVSTGPDPSIQSPPPPGVAAPVNGPFKAGQVKTGPAGIVPPPNPPSTGGIQQPPAARKQAVARADSSPKMLVAILGLIGAVLVAGAGVGGWFWWKSHEASPQPVATAVQPTPSATIPAPAETKPSPLGNPPADQPPPETAPAAPVPVPGANDVAKSAKPKRTPKPKPDTTAKIVPPIPAPVAPVQPPPAPVAAPTPPPPNPAPPKPEVQTPVMVNDALPFVVNLAEDVPADAPEGQALHFTVKEGLQVGDKTVIAKGATVTGAVAGESGKKGFLGIGGHKLTFRLAQAEAVDGRKLAVRAMAGKNGDGLTIRPFDTGKASKSKGYAALQGTVYIAYIDGDQIVAVRR
jgi:hypothetical protein